MKKTIISVLLLTSVLCFGAKQPPSTSATLIETSVFNGTDYTVTFSGSGYIPNTTILIQATATYPPSDTTDLTSFTYLPGSADSAGNFTATTHLPSGNYSMTAVQYWRWTRTLIPMAYLNFSLP